MTTGRCSDLSGDVGEPLSATAPRGTAYVLLEQPGPWGRKAARSSHLDRDLGAELDDRAKAAGTTLLLIRRSGRHPDNHPTRRALIVAHPRAGWLESGTIEDPRTLLDLDFAALASGIAPGVGTSATNEIVLVCTNGRRDLCCAIKGRPLLDELEGRVATEQLWEVAHIGGHRFSPTVLLLPSGIVLGRASSDDVLAGLAGRPPLAAYRGRAGQQRQAQAAEAYVLRQRDDVRPIDLTVADPVGDGPWTVDVLVNGGQRWRVDVEHRLGDVRPESCGREPEPYECFVAVGAQQIGN